MSDSSPIHQLEAFVIDNDELNQLESLIAEFNIFEALGAVRQELRHSDFLAFLLNPSEKHGLGDLFLKRFLIGVLSVADDPPITPIQIDVTNLSNAIVERETHHIDILIHDADSDLVCVIENKIFSDEHSNQLERYLETVQRRFASAYEANRVVSIFLTPDGTPPTDENSPYIPFSYGQVAEIMEKVRQAQESMLGADINTMTRHYVTMLRRHIVSDSDIAQLCQQIYRAHKAAIDLIVEHRPDLQKEVADYLATLIEGNPAFAKVRHSKSYVDFVPRNWAEIPELNMGTGWTNSKTTLTLEFANASDRLILYLELGPVEQGNEHVRETIYAYANTNRDVFRGGRSRLGKHWTALYKTTFLRPTDYQDASLEDLIQIIEPKWNQFTQNTLPELNRHIMQIPFK